MDDFEQKVKRVTQMRKRSGVVAERGNRMRGVWIAEFRRRYIKGDKFQPDFIISQKGKETAADYASRVREVIAQKNQRAINFDYRAKCYIRAQKGATDGE